MSATPAGRYGPVRTERGRRVALTGRVTGAVIGGAIVIALLVWIGGAVLRDPVQWSDVGFSVRGSGSVEVTFDVVKDPKVSAQCTIHALNSGFAEVGVITMTAGPAPSRVVRHTVTVATQELAVTGVVDTCHVLGGGAK